MRGPQATVNKMCGRRDRAVSNLPFVFVVASPYAIQLRASMNDSESPKTRPTVHNEHFSPKTA